MADVFFNAQAEEDVAGIARYIGIEKQNPQAARDYTTPSAGRASRTPVSP